MKLFGHPMSTCTRKTLFTLHETATPFEYFDETTPDRVIKVSMAGELLEGDYEPSPAVEFHAAFRAARFRERSRVYRGRRSAGCSV